jgi:hypothetical protein
MARQKKLSPQAVRTIFKSKERAADIAKQFKVSQNLVYLIRARRIHSRVTNRLKEPERPRRGRPSGQNARIDVKQLANAIVQQLVRRLRGK